jgi:hypothetical protein
MDKKYAKLIGEGNEKRVRPVSGNGIVAIVNAEDDC